MYLMKRLLEAVAGGSEPSNDAVANRYVPKAFDGEFNVSFESKPLGIGLVPSTQLYGTWEVSSLAHGLQQLTPNASKQSSQPATGNGVAWTAAEANSKSPKRTTTTIRRSSSSSITSPLLRVDTSSKPRAHARSRSFSSLSPQQQQQQQQQQQPSPCSQCKSPCVGKCWQTIQLGDVLIAINHDPSKAQLSREELSQFLLRLSCPIVVTFRRPSRYGSSDSHSLVTAMYPTSIDYFGVSPSKMRHSRASSAQWKRGLQIELEKNYRTIRKRRSHSLYLAEPDRRQQQEQLQLAAEQQEVDAHTKGTEQEQEQDHQPDQEVSSSDSPQSKAQGIAEKPKVHAAAAAVAAASAMTPAKPTIAKMSKRGEFTVAFNETPIEVIFAPSTRLYGTVEVYDPKSHKDELEVGDVVMQVNNDRSVSQWQTDDLMDFLMQLQSPVEVVFRRPAVYRRYVDALYQSPKILSSRSLARSMFPNTPEYKRPSLRAAAVGDGGSVTKYQVSMTTSLSPSASGGPVGSGDFRGELPPLHELRAFSAQLSKSDQFKLWSNPQTKQESSVLTVRYVRFLRNALPSFLSCNEMNLVYSTRIHGWNLLSFYAQLEDKGPTVMVVKDHDDNVFGAFCPSAWHHSNSVFGNGRAFVFQLSPQMNAFGWSGYENSFMYGQRDCLFIGGGRKGIALAIQLDEARGFTQPCETFDSPPLSPHGEFQCQTIEVWAFTGLKV